MRENFGELSDQRNNEADNLTEMAIHRSVVKKIMAMDADLSEKVQILLQSCPVSVIISQLSLLKYQGAIDFNQFNKFMEKCLLGLNNDRSYGVTVDHSFKYLKYGE